MPAERYFYDNELIEKQILTIEDQEFHHLVHVMRSEVGSRIEIVNGRGNLGIGQVVEIKKKQKVLIQILEVSFQARSEKELILAQAVPRGNRLDIVLEKGTELGMTQLWLFPGKKSERQDISETQIERMKSVTVAAMKQCGRLYLPEIELRPPLIHWKGCESFAFFGDLDADVSLMEECRTVSDSRVIFFVGPESGFAEEEVEKLKAMGVKGVKLHENILRTDTASLVALSLLSQKMN